jgi:hypothetical protein
VLGRREIKEQVVVLAFQRAGLHARAFTSPGPYAQFTIAVGKVVPAVVVSVYATNAAARKSPPTIAINGKRVRAIAVENVRIFVASAAPGDVRRQVSRAIAFLRRV